MNMSDNLKKYIDWFYLWEAENDIFYSAKEKEHTEAEWAEHRQKLKHISSVMDSIELTDEEVERAYRIKKSANEAKRKISITPEHKKRLDMFAHAFAQVPDRSGPFIMI